MGPRGPWLKNSRWNMCKLFHTFTAPQFLTSKFSIEQTQKEEVPFVWLDSEMMPQPLSLPYPYIRTYRHRSLSPPFQVNMKLWKAGLKTSLSALAKECRGLLPKSFHPNQEKWPARTKTQVCQASSGGWLQELIWNESTLIQQAWWHTENGCSSLCGVCQVSLGCLC